MTAVNNQLEMIDSHVHCVAYPSVSDQQMVSSESKAVFAMLSPLSSCVISLEVQKNFVIPFLK